MKVVIDTNVYIAAMMTNGHCERVLRHAWKHHSVIVSKEIINECEQVLRKKLRFTSQETKKICRLIRRHGQTATVTTVLKKRITRDRMDDHVLALAQQERVDVVITGDQDILVIKKYQGIPLLSPTEYWLFEKQQEQ